MKVLVIYWVILVILLVDSHVASVNDDQELNSNRERCANTADDEPVMKDRSQYGPYDLYQPRQRYEIYDKRPQNRLDAKKRSLDSEYDEESDTIQKRQVGVVYGNGKPIGILEPFQQSYKFIPVKDESLSSGIDKREASRDLNRDDYPSILANFKINSKVGHSRFHPQKRDLNRNVRKVRQSNTDKIEEKLKGILDDMGLIDGEDRDEKREIDDEEDQLAERRKRQRSSNAKPLSSASQKEDKNRKKRDKDDSELLQNLEESGDLQLTGNKSPLASRSEVETRDSDDSDVDGDGDEEKRIERQIKQKISTLRDEVKQEIGALRAEQEENNRRKKRQATLIDAEKKELNPVNNLREDELKPLIRRRRAVDDDDDLKDNQKSQDDDKKIGKDRENRQESRNQHDQLHDDDTLIDEDLAMKREINKYPDLDLDNLFYERDKRSRYIPSNTEDFYDYYFDEDNDRSKRQDIDYDYLHRAIPFGKNAKRNKLRYRRRVEEPVERMNRPQQLNDMSDTDIFGALPKTYGGELSRYKRVKRKNRN